MSTSVQKYWKTSAGMAEHARHVRKLKSGTRAPSIGSTYSDYVPKSLKSVVRRRRGRRGGGNPSTRSGTPGRTDGFSGSGKPIRSRKRLKKGGGRKTQSKRKNRKSKKSKSRRK